MAEFTSTLDSELNDRRECENINESSAGDRLILYRVDVYSANEARKEQSEFRRQREMSSDMQSEAVYRFSLSDSNNLPFVMAGSIYKSA